MNFYIETYGCQMNVADSEVVSSILQQAGHIQVNKADEADLILLNTCSIRENAEQRVRGRLDVFRNQKKKNNRLLVGVLGCMAERLKEQLLEEEKVVDLVVGPDSYRNIPALIEECNGGKKAIDVLLSQDETYADISPIRYDSNGVSAFISIMRGCQNMCSYCIVPYVRGKERSRPPMSIMNEMLELEAGGYKEVTLIGQNVDSYEYDDPGLGQIVRFPMLLAMVSGVVPEMRIRFSTNHPKDLSDDLLKVIASCPNICRSIHLPVQSGSSGTLGRMNRGYDREWYLNRIHAIRSIVPDCSLSTDIMVGFCGESETEHQETLSLMQEVEYDFAFMFKYSERPGTYASSNMKDDVPEEIKVRRLNEVIELQNKISARCKSRDLGKTYEVLAEGISKKSDQELFGRNSQNKVVVFPKGNYSKGDFVTVKVVRCTSATLIGEIVNEEI
jgi:tRNA-2-methylthio-N6-dimethylallyladenosine synthase